MGAPIHAKAARVNATLFHADEIEAAEFALARKTINGLPTIRERLLREQEQLEEFGITGVVNIGELDRDHFRAAQAYRCGLEQRMVERRIARGGE